MPGRNAREGTAFIGIDAESPQTYSAGALLANGARLTEIHRDHVVLTRGEESAKLYLQSVQSTAISALSALVQVGGVTSGGSPPPVSHDVVTDYIRPSPVFDGDQIKGYQVYPGKRGGVFSQLGLKGGDVITAINDAPFADAMQAMDLFQQLAKGTALVATIQREGVTSRLSLDGQLIVADQEQQKDIGRAAAGAPFSSPPT